MPADVTIMCAGLTPRCSNTEIVISVLQLKSRLKSSWWVDSLQLKSMRSARGTLGVAPTPGRSTRISRIPYRLARGSSCQRGLGQAIAEHITLRGGEPPATPTRQHPEHRDTIRIADVGIGHRELGAGTFWKALGELSKGQIAQWVGTR